MTTAIQRSDEATIFEDLSGSPHHRVDAAAGVIRGVKLIGLESNNRRRYPAHVLRAAAPLYEGAKVNVNHPNGDPLSARGYEDRIGSIRNVRATEQGLYGDFHFNPKHRLAEQVLWDATHSPAAVGFSHNATLRMTGDKRGGKVGEEIVAVRSVDLVADPATTSSIFESEEVSHGEAQQAMKAAFRSAIVAIVNDDALDMRQKFDRIKAAMTLQERMIDKPAEKKFAMRQEPTAAEVGKMIRDHKQKNSQRQPTSEQIKRFRAQLLGYDPDRAAPRNIDEFLERLREEPQQAGRGHAAVDATEFSQRLRDGGRKLMAIDAVEFHRRLRGEQRGSLTVAQFTERLRT